MPSTSRGYRYPANTDHTRLWEHIQNLATDVNTDIEAGFGATWTDSSGTFAITGTTTNPTKGNSTYTQRWIKPAKNLVHVETYILIGSTFAAGAGLYRFSVPVPCEATGMLTACGVAIVIDSGTAGRTASAHFVDSTHIELFRDGDAGPFSAANPQVWATGDSIKISIDYRPA